MASVSSSASMSSSNSTSGSIDVAAIVENFMVYENKPLDVINSKITKQSQIITDLGNVKSKLSTLNTALDSFQSASSYNTVVATSSALSQISATATNGAPLGRYDIVAIQTAEPTKVNISGTNVLGNLSNVTVDARGFQLTVAGVTSTFTNGTSTTKLSDLNAWINGLGGDVTASVLPVDSLNWNLSIQGKKTGISSALSVRNINGGSVVDNGNGTGSAVWSNGVQETFNSRGITYSTGITQTNNLTFLSAVNSSSPTVTLSQGGVSTPIGEYSFTSSSSTSLTITNNQTGLSQTVPVSTPVNGTNTLSFNEFGIRISYTTSATPGDTATQIVSDFIGKKISIVAPVVTGSDISLKLNKAAKDAIVSVNGVSYTRSSNTITDIISNTTIKLVGSVVNPNNPLSATVELAKGTDNSSTTIQGLMTAYNEVINLYKTLTQNPSLTTTAGSLSTDKSLLSFISDFKQRFSEGVTYAASSNISFSEMGISMQIDGTLKFDSIKYTIASANGLQEKLSNGAIVGKRSATDTLKSSINEVLKFKGTIDTNVDNKNQLLSQLGKSKSDLSSKLERIRANYTTQYSQLNTMLYKLNITSSALTSSLTALTNMNASK